MSLQFTVIMLVALYPMRKLGWALSGIFYFINLVIAVILLSLWGGILGITYRN